MIIFLINKHTDSVREM